MGQRLPHLPAEIAFLCTVSLIHHDDDISSLIELAFSLGEFMDRGDNDVDYLDLPSEEEAFKIQLEYKEREEGEESAEDYVEGLLDHHKIKGKEREEKKQELMEEG